MKRHSNHLFVLFSFAAAAAGCAVDPASPGDAEEPAAVQSAVVGEDEPPPYPWTAADWAADYAAAEAAGGEVGAAATRCQYYSMKADKGATSGLGTIEYKENCNGNGSGTRYLIQKWRHQRYGWYTTRFSVFDASTQSWSSIERAGSGNVTYYVKTSGNLGQLGQTARNVREALIAGRVRKGTLLLGSVCRFEQGEAAVAASTAAGACSVISPTCVANVLVAVLELNDANHYCNIWN